LEEQFRNSGKFYYIPERISRPAARLSLAQNRHRHLEVKARSVNGKAVTQDHRFARDQFDAVPFNDPANPGFDAF